MTKHLQTEIDKLKRMILELGALVEERVYLAVKAVETRDAILAGRVLKSDKDIDDREVEVEEECLKVLALHQPVAIDLRLIVAVLKMNNDLERIGDLAVNIAWRANSLSKLPRINSPFDVHDMAEKVKSMLKRSLGALVNLDIGEARAICAADEAIDEINREVFQIITANIQAQPEHAESYINFFSVSRNLERIADHATNIAEDVIYMVEGAIVRHGRGQLS